jgi:hypothetical protein
MDEGIKSVPSVQKPMRKQWGVKTSISLRDSKDSAFFWIVLTISCCWHTQYMTFSQKRKAVPLNG